MRTRVSLKYPMNDFRPPGQVSEGVYPGNYILRLPAPTSSSDSVNKCH